jgi:hypothetical protein
MAKVPDLLDSLGVAEDGISTAYPETFVSDIRSAYDEDATIPAARISVLEADLAAAQKTITDLKAHNYELMVSVPVTDPDAAPEDDPDEDPEDSDNDDNRGVDSLFKEKKDD